MGEQTYDYIHLNQFYICYILKYYMVNITVNDTVSLYLSYPTSILSISFNRMRSIIDVNLFIKFSASYRPTEGVCYMSFSFSHSLSLSLSFPVVIT